MSAFYSMLIIDFSKTNFKSGHKLPKKKLIQTQDFFLTEIWLQWTYYDLLYSVLFPDKKFQQCWTEEVKFSCLSAPLRPTPRRHSRWKLGVQCVRYTRTYSHIQTDMWQKLENIVTWLWTTGYFILFKHRLVFYRIGVFSFIWSIFCLDCVQYCK